MQSYNDGYMDLTESTTGSFNDDWIMVNKDYKNTTTQKLYDTCYENLLTVCSIGNMDGLIDAEHEINEITDIIQNDNPNPIQYRHYVNAFTTAATENQLHICKYLYNKYDVITGKKRTIISNIVNNLFHSSSHLQFKIDQRLFITCCKRKCIDVALWMLCVTTFDIDILISAITEAMLVKCYYLCSYIYDILKQNGRINNFIGMFIRLAIEKNIHDTLVWFYQKDIYTFNLYTPSIFLDLCYYGRFTSIKWLLDTRINNIRTADTIHPASLYNGLKSSCVNDHTRVFDTLCSAYGSNYIIPLITNDPNRHMYNEAIRYSAQGILRWLNGIRSYNIKIEGFTADDKIAFSASSSNYNLIYSIDEIMKLIPSSFINCKVSISDILSDNQMNKYYMFTKNTIHYILLKSLAKIDVTNEIIDAYLDCQIFYTTIQKTVTKIRLNIEVNSYIKINDHMNQIYKCDTISTKNIMADLVINQIEFSTNKSYAHIDSNNENPYRSLFMNLLNMKNIKSSHDTNNINITNINIIEEHMCPSCMGEIDMVLECGHTFCMSCAYLWFIKGANEKICPVCRKNINVDDSISVI